MHATKHQILCGAHAEVLLTSHAQGTARNPDRLAGFRDVQRPQRMHCHDLAEPAVDVQDFPFQAALTYAGGRLRYDRPEPLLACLQCLVGADAFGRFIDDAEDASDRAMRIVRFGELSSWSDLAAQCGALY